MTQPFTADTLRDALCQPWKHGEHVEASGLILTEPLVLDGRDICGFDLSGAQLNGGLSARGTRFRGLAWLRDVRVTGPCDLSGAQFRTDLRADGLRADRLDLSGCYLEGVLALARAHLGALSLADAVIMANVTLEDAEIGAEVDLSRALLMGGLWADNARAPRWQQTETDIHGRLRQGH